MSLLLLFTSEPEPAPVDPGLAALQQPVGSWYEAKDTADGQIVSRINSAHVATLGPTPGPEGDDPIYLPYDGKPYVFVPSAIGNFVRTNEATDVTPSTIELAVRVTSPRATSNQAMVGNRATQHRLIYGTDHRIRIGVYDGAVFIGDGSSEALPEALRTGVKVWLRGRLTIATALCEYWYSTDDTDDFSAVTNWIQFGTPAGANAGSTPRSSTVERIVGAAGTLVAGCEARYHAAAWVYNGTLDTTWKAVDIDTSAGPDAGQTSMVSGGLTWTVNRAETGKKTAVVTRPLWLFDGGDDYVQLPAADTPTLTATAGKLTVIVAFRKHGIISSQFPRLWSAESASNNGLHIRLAGSGTSSIGATYGGSSTQSSIGGNIAYTSGKLHVAAVTVNNGSASFFFDGIKIGNSLDITTHGDASFVSPRIGSRGGGAPASLADGEIFICRCMPGVALDEETISAITSIVKSGSYS